MDKMMVKMPVAVKAKVTESLKAKLIAELQDGVKAANLDLEQFEFAAKRAINEQANQDERMLDALQHSIEVERAKRTSARDEVADKLKRAEKLELGAEIGHGQLERTVEIEVGTDLDQLLGAEIVTEDGKIIAFRA
ncbi:MAG: YlqD family protein [Acidaminococcaceae bacterium]|nr:YlqD family protein [Acidaminococcaceae bacterium]